MDWSDRLTSTTAARVFEMPYQQLRNGNPYKMPDQQLSKPLQEAKIATFNARVETVDTKPFFRDA